MVMPSASPALPWKPLALRAEITQMLPLKPLTATIEHAAYTIFKGDLCSLIHFYDWFSYRIIYFKWQDACDEDLVPKMPMTASPQVGLQESCLSNRVSRVGH
jgi:hypothetical protein